MTEELDAMDWDELVERWDYCAFITRHLMDERDNGNSTDDEISDALDRLDDVTNYMADRRRRDREAGHRSDS